jgi:hypothetical protein
MKNKLLALIFCNFIIFSAENIYAEVPNAAEITVCQDQAENYGNGKSEDIVAMRCLSSFKKRAQKKAITESFKNNTKYFGYKNMIIIESTKDNIISTEIIAGNSTELKSIIAIALDEKNKELVVLEESGDVYFFTTTLTGNIAPYRILKHTELLGAKEIAVDQVNDQVLIYNKKSDKILFFSRLANKNAPKERQFLKILKTISTESINYNDETLSTYLPKLLPKLLPN